MKEGWEYKKLGEVLVFDKRFNGIPKDNQPRITQFTHVSAEVLKNLKTEKGEVKLLSTGLFSAYTTIDLARDYINEGEVVTIPTGGVANIKYHKGKFVDSGNILGVSSGPDILLKFVYYGMIANNELINSYFRGVSIKHPYMPDIYNITIPVPPLSVQQQIVEELDLLNCIIEKKKEQLKELDNLAQSIFYDMFGDPITNDKGWEIKKLNDNVYEMFLGPFGSALKVDSYVSKENSYCMVYEQKHAIQATLDIDTHYINYNKYESLKRFEVRGGDFIMSCRGTIGKVFRLPTNAPLGIIHPSLMKIRIKEEAYHPLFFQYMLIKVVANEQTNGNCVQMAITAKELGKKSLPTPPLSFQQQFASKIEAIELQKELIKQSIKEVEMLFNSRMDYYFN